MVAALAVVFGLNATIVSAYASPPVLIEQGDLRVTAADFEAFLLRVPESQREEFRASFERVTKTVESIHTNRVLAREARRLGYDQDPLVMLNATLLVEGFLAQQWMARFRSSIDTPDMRARAQEIYALNPDRFREPERIWGEYLQISLVGRTREAAMERAQEARSKLLNGETFEAVASAYNDDRRPAKDRGRLEGVARSQLDKAVAEAAFSLPTPGAISEPIESGRVLHLFRLQKKVPGRLKSFEEVRSELMAAEVDQFRGLETDRRIGELKNTDLTKVHEANILKLLTSTRSPRTPATEVIPAR